MLFKKNLSLIIALIMAVTTVFSFPVTAMAEEAGIEDTESVVTITAIDALESTVASQEITAYSGKTPTLPGQLTAVNDMGETIQIDVNWTSDKTFEGNAAGTYKYIADLNTELHIADGVQIPVITVDVIKCETTMTGVDSNLSYKSRGKAYDTITVYNGYGRVLKHQMWNGKKWITKKSVNLNDAATQKIKFYYTNDWWKVTSSKWRFKIEGNDGATSYTSKTTT